jgi:GntR family transcriptional regulator
VTATPVVEIDLDDPTPPYAQLRRKLAALIDRGVLAVGQRLPTVRQLAGDLGIAAGTVMRAYKELEDAGYVRGERRRGTVVAGPRRSGPMDIDAALRDLAASYLTDAARMGATPGQALAAVSRAVAECSGPEPDGSAAAERAGRE